MNPYATFLMIELARVKGLIPKELEYDLTWEMGWGLYKEYELTKFNDTHEPEYECISKFLDDKLEYKRHTEPKDIKYKVIVRRLSSATRDIEVMAVNKTEAKQKAMELAGDEVFETEDDADYEVENVFEID